MQMLRIKDECLTLHTLYLKGKTQFEPDWVTQLLGTLCTGTRVSASRKQEAGDPIIIIIIIIITDTDCFIIIIAAEEVEDCVLAPVLLCVYIHVWSSSFLVARFPGGFQPAQDSSQYQLWCAGAALITLHSVLHSRPRYHQLGARAKLIQCNMDTKF